MRFGRRRVPPPDSAPLEEVFEAERAAAAEMATARHEAAAWLAAEKAAIEQRLGEDLVSLEASHAAAVEDAKLQASIKAGAVVAAAETYAGELQSIRDDDLLPILVRHLAAILPGGAT